MLNDTPNQRIPEATRAKVWAAVRQLQYAPSAAARTLRSGKSDIVLWLMPDWPTSETTARMIDQLTAGLSRAGFTLVVHSRSAENGSLSEVWMSMSPVAVVVWEPPSAADRDSMRAAGTEVVLSLTPGRPPRGDVACDSVGMELAFERTGRLQVEHLASRGHRRLGYALPDDLQVMSFATARLAAVRAECAARGLPEPDCRTVGLDPDRAAAAVAHWRGLAEPVTAVCAFNDQVALAVLAGLRRHNLRAPEDLALIGVDDMSIAPLADPPLTTVRMKDERLTAYVVEAIVGGLAGRAAPSPPGPALMELVERATA